jgi:glycosyltransferase involved in cell wall biosynthesis
LRLGLLIYGSLDHISGGFLYDRRLVEYLRSQGDRVEVVSLPWRSYARGLLDNLRPGWLNYLRQAPFDALLQDELAHPSLFRLNRWLRARVSYPIVAIVHHLRCCEPHPHWQNRLYRWTERRYLNSVDALVCVSRTTRADVESLVGNSRPVVVAPPGGDGLPGAVTLEQVAARAAAPGPLQVIFVGNVIPRKELHTLIDALATLPSGDWHLQVAGSLSADPPYAAAVRRRINSRGLVEQVSLLGTLAAPELAARLRASHVLAVPSSYEGFGIAYLEAMRFGLPAIAGAQGAAGEIVKHGRNGFLAPPGNVAALAGFLRLLMRDRERLTAMSLDAYQSYASHPTWQESAGMVRGFLQGLGKPA